LKTSLPKRTWLEPELVEDRTITPCAAGKVIDLDI